MDREKIIILGADKGIEDRLVMLDKLNKYEVEEIWDNFVQKKIVYKNKSWTVAKPYKPENLRPILIVSSRYEKDIRQQLIKLGIPEVFIKSWWYCFHYVKDEIIRKYSDVHDEYIEFILEYLKNHELHVYNCGLFEKYHYKSKDIKIFNDDSSDLLYSYWDNKKLYMKRGMTVNEARSYINSLIMEQEKESPHCYEQLGSIGRGNDVIVDAGAAEGFFALERIETAKHIYLIECDNDWLEALKHTFAAYADRVTIIPKFLSDKNDDMHVALDTIDSMRDPLTVIKMDIEGAEKDALVGAKNILSGSRNISILACVYHKIADFEEITAIMSASNLDISVTKGYMFFPYGEEISSELRHGVVIGCRRG